MTGPDRTPPLPRHLRVLPASAVVDRSYLAARYGNRAPSLWGVGVVVALVVLPFVGWVVWAGLMQADQEVRWATTGFSGQSETAVTVEFDVFLPPDTDVVCVVRALDRKGVEVGRAEVPVRADRDDIHVVYDLAVTARPSSALVDSCRIAG